jgi:hypothetical protein
LSGVGLTSRILVMMQSCSGIEYDKLHIPR